MEPRDACLRVVAEAAPASLHWTEVLDRALKARYVDPFTNKNVRSVVVRALVELTREGRLVKASTGRYALPGQSDPGQSDPGQSDPGQSDPGQSDPGQSDPGQSVKPVA